MPIRTHRLFFLILLGSTTLAACSKHEEDKPVPAFHPPVAETRALYLDRLNKSFDQMDGNSDDVIQLAAIDGHRAAELRSRDADHDGFLTREEFVEGGLARFDRIDRNHDGVLTKAEHRADHGGPGDTGDNVTP